MKHIWTALAGLVVLGLFSLTVVACGDDGPGDDASGNDASGNDAPALETVCTDGCQTAIACDVVEMEQAECEADCHSNHEEQMEGKSEECDVATLEFKECLGELSCEHRGDFEAEEEECADELDQTENVCELD